MFFPADPPTHPHHVVPDCVVKKVRGRVEECEREGLRDDSRMQEGGRGAVERRKYLIVLSKSQLQMEITNVLGLPSPM